MKKISEKIDERKTSDIPVQFHIRCKLFDPLISTRHASSFLGPSQSQIPPYIAETENACVNYYRHNYMQQTIKFTNFDFNRITNLIQSRKHYHVDHFFYLKKEEEKYLVKKLFVGYLKDFVFLIIGSLKKKLIPVEN